MVLRYDLIKALLECKVIKNILVILSKQKHS